MDSAVDRLLDLTLRLKATTGDKSLAGCFDEINSVRAEIKKRLLGDAETIPTFTQSNVICHYCEHHVQQTCPGGCVGNTTAFKGRALLPTKVTATSSTTLTIVERRCSTCGNKQCGRVSFEPVPQLCETEERPHWEEK